MFFSQTCELKDTEIHRSNPWFESLAEECSTARLCCCCCGQSQAQSGQNCEQLPGIAPFLHLFAGSLKALSSKNLEIAFAPISCSLKSGF